MICSSSYCSEYGMVAFSTLSVVMVICRVDRHQDVGTLRSAFVYSGVYDERNASFFSVMYYTIPCIETPANQYRTCHAHNNSGEEVAHFRALLRKK